MKPITGPFVKLMRVEDLAEYAEWSPEDQAELAGSYVHTFAVDESGEYLLTSDGKLQLVGADDIDTSYSNTINLLMPDPESECVVRYRHVAFFAEGTYWLPLKPQYAMCN